MHLQLKTPARSLIGANTGSVIEGYYTSYEYICSRWEWDQCHANNSPAYCMLVCEREIQVPYYVSVQAGSDGLVSIYSQQSVGTNWSVSNDRLLEVVSVNHHEMRGHPNMRSALNQAFNRDDFYKTLVW